MTVSDNKQRNSAGSYSHFLIYSGIGIFGFWLFSIIISRTIYPFDLGHLEAFNLMPAEHLLEGRNPYAFAATPPYSMATYGVGFYALLAIGLKFFGFQLWFGRVLSVWGFAACSWAAVKITRKITGNFDASYVTGLLCLALFPGQAWIGVMRADLIGAAFGLIAVWLVFRFEEDRKIRFRNIWFIGLLACTAFFTKQTFFLPTGIVILRFLQLKKWRAALYFTAQCLILIPGIMFLLNYTSAGGYFWQHFTHAKTLPFIWKRLLFGVSEILEAPTTIVFILFLLFFAYLNHRSFSRQIFINLHNLLKSPKLLISFYFLLSFVMSTLAMGRVGANVNYYLECSFLVAIIGGLIYEDLGQRAFLRLSSVFLILLISGTCFQLIRITRGEYFRWQALGYYEEISKTSAGFITPNSTCVSIYDELVARNGCAFNFDDIGEYTSYWASPELSKTFEREVKAGHYDVIIWNNDKFQEMYPNYRLIPMSQSPPERFYKVYLYVRETSTSQ